MSDLRFSNRRAGFYWVDQIPYVSVTNVLKVIDKPALRYWFGREVYLAMVKNPSMAEKEALSAPYVKSQAAATRGSAVHKIVEEFKQSQEHLKTIDDPYKPYAQAFYNWVEDNHIAFVENERTVISKKYGYAGTCDLIVKKNGDGVWLCDVKTGKDIYLESHIQLSAYKKALEENGVKIDRMGVILLKDTGTYKFEEVDECFDIFLACKTLWQFLNKEDCEKLGYKGGDINA
jgi:hypothetical protein